MNKQNIRYGSRLTECEEERDLDITELKDGDLILVNPGIRFLQIEKYTKTCILGKGCFATRGASEESKAKIGDYPGFLPRWIWRRSSF